MWLFSVSTANAFEQRFYLGGGFGQSMVKPDPRDTGYGVSESTDSASELFVGWDYDARWSLELYYSDLGAASLRQMSGQNLVPPRGTIDYTAFGVSAIAYFFNLSDAPGLLTRSGLSLFAGGGFGSLKTESSSLPIEQLEDWHINLTAGLEYGLSNGVATRLQLIGYDSDAMAVSLRVLYRFGESGEAYTGEAYTGEVYTVVAEPASSPPPVDIDTREVQAGPVSMPVEASPDVAVISLDSDADGVSDTADSCPDTVYGAQVDGVGCPLFDGRIDGLTFAPGSDQLTASGRTALDAAAAKLLLYPNVNVALMAHTDNVGSAAGNLQLSKRRALAVARYLTDRGIEKSRLNPEAYGESSPVASNASEQGRELNRRVEFRTLQ